MPAPPLVPPSDCRLSMAARIASFLWHGVEGSSRGCCGVADDPQPVVLGQPLDHQLQPRLDSGSLFSSDIEPEVSIRNTRFDGGRLAGSIVFPFSPIRARRWPASHGQAATSTRTENGSSPGGGVVVGEVIHHLFDTNRVHRRKLALRKEPADIGIRAVSTSIEKVESSPPGTTARKGLS